MNYGLPYMGSKSKIVKHIVPLFPYADNFVDLFAGGGAVTHYAMTTAKYKHFVFNDINPLMPKAFEMALNGEFEKEKRWISREEFFRLRDTDPYVAICFSFGNNLSNYMYGNDIEPIKEAYHYALFFGDYILAMERMGIDLTPLEKCHTIKEKYAMLKHIVKTTPNPPQTQWKQGCSQWKGNGEFAECGGKATVHFTPPNPPTHTHKVSKCGAKNQMWRNARKWGASGSPCLTLSSFIQPTTQPCRYPKTALSTAIFRIRTQERTKDIKRRSSTMSGSMIGLTDRHNRYSSASIGCPKIGLGALRKLNVRILFRKILNLKRLRKEYSHLSTNKRKYRNN